MEDFREVDENNNPIDGGDDHGSDGGNNSDYEEICFVCRRSLSTAVPEIGSR